MHALIYPTALENYFIFWTSSSVSAIVSRPTDESRSMHEAHSGYRGQQVQLLSLVDHYQPSYQVIRQILCFYKT